MAAKPKLIIILGPTATGKSDLAVNLAKKFNGEIISADSRQVYRGMDIGTGKITKKEMRGIPHYLLDVASPKRRFTVAQYKRLAEKAIKNILIRGKIPIICGGAGFYIQAVTENLAIPEVKPNLKLRAKLEKKSIGELFSELKRLDHARAATIDPHNPRRLIRALEIIYKTGKPVSTLVIPAKAGIQTSEPGFRAKPGMTKEYDVLYLGIKKSSSELKKLIADRLQKRLKQGMIEEVKNLRQASISWKKLDDFGLEYRWIARFLQKKVSHVEMTAKLQKEIEHYAKRQMTWFKRNKKIRWIENESQAGNFIQEFIKK